MIVETEHNVFESWQAVFADHGCELSLEEWAVCIGTVGAFDPFATLESRATTPVDRGAVQLDQARAEERLVDSLPPLPGVVDRVSEAHRLGLRVGVASSSPRAWVERHLTRLDLLHRFAHLSCYDEVGSAKPLPHLYLAVAEAIGVPPARVFALEDSPNGIAAAKAAGMACVAVPTAMTRSLDLGRADLVIDSLAATTLEEVMARLQ